MNTVFRPSKIDFLITQSSLAVNLLGMVGLGLSGVFSSVGLFVAS